VLAARIDRLTAEEKAFLQQLSVIGRQFPASLVKHVVPQAEDELYQVLSSLQRKEFLYEQPAFPEVEYLFKHALTQEVAYNSVLIERRKALHEQTAQAIEQLFHDQVDDHYSELAHHYSRSENTQKAIDYLYLAGQQAVQRSANQEAINHLTAALDLIKTLPDTAERVRQELDIEITLGPVLTITQGYATPEIGTIYARAQELCQQVDESPQLGRVLRGLWGFYVARGGHTTAREFGEQLVRLAQRTQDSSLLVEGYYALGASLMWLGELNAAHHHVEQGIAIYSPQKHRSHTFLYGQDPGVFCRCYAAETLWALGYPDQGLKRVEEALSLAQEIAHPYSLAIALLVAGAAHSLRREGQQVQRYLQALLALCNEQGFLYMSALGTPYQGWALAEQGKMEEGIPQIRQGIAAIRATGAEGILTWDLGKLAEAQGWAGKNEEGLETLAEALEIVQKTEERWWEAELYRLKGELTLQQWKVESQKSQVPNPQPLTPNPQAEGEREAEACFLKAIDVARHQQAKSLELRGVMSLVRLRQQQASEHGAGSTEQGVRTKLAEAHRMLSEIYHWFTEGFDTADLRDAKALLDELTRDR
jgi:predicted ATPase